MYCHQAVAGIPLDGNCLPDVQEEHGGLFSRPCPPPCIGRLTAKILPGLSGSPVALEFLLAAVWAGDSAVQHVARAAAENLNLII
jgi:hypothetical protein